MCAGGSSAPRSIRPVLIEQHGHRAVARSDRRESQSRHWNVLDAAESFSEEQRLRHEEGSEAGEWLLEEADGGRLWRRFGRGRDRQSVKQCDRRRCSEPVQKRSPSATVGSSPVHWFPLIGPGPTANARGQQPGGEHREHPARCSVELDRLYY